MTDENHMTFMLASCTADHLGQADQAELLLSVLGLVM